MNKVISEDKFEFSLHTSILILLGIFLAGILIRINYVDFNSLLTLDALFYFWYGMDINVLNEFPRLQEGENIVYNNGWPAFLGMFFLMSNSDQILDYMLIQKSLSIIISTLTIFPIYFLCRRFFNRTYSVLGGAIFILEPRIVQNSLLGITEPAYIFLTSAALVLFVSHEKKMNYLAFALVGATAIVRNEGIFLLIPFSIIFLVRYRKEKFNIIPKYLICLGIFALVIFPMAIIKMDTMGTDGIFSRLTAESANLAIKSEKSNSSYSEIIVTSFSIFIKFLGWTAIPIFVIFVPIGVYRILKERIFERRTVIFTYFIMLIPILYAYSIPALDTRYLFVVFPIYCILSILAIRFVVEKYNFNKNFVFLIILLGVGITSIAFLENIIDTNEKDPEILEISTKMNQLLKDAVIFGYGKDTIHLQEGGLLQLESFPISKQEYNQLVPKIISISGITFDELEEYIKFGKELGLTHIIVNTDSNLPLSFQEVFRNESNYEYLEKVFDSNEEGYQYQIKIFKVNFSKFNDLSE